MNGSGRGAIINLPSARRPPNLTEGTGTRACASPREAGRSDPHSARGLSQTNTWPDIKACLSPQSLVLGAREGCRPLREPGGGVQASVRPFSTAAGSGGPTGLAPGGHGRAGRGASCEGSPPKTWNQFSASSPALKYRMGNIRVYYLIRISLIAFFIFKICNYAKCWVAT